ncbi:ketopantoate reductase family protein [Antarctobacter sp.]|uniref:ketopantoate reductase family protein n=1 Tax=Antarctobacter sp. TaxID=1872577 RepID=UPI002B273A4C|nr:2-dehydropantoate 2-reductase N-terminal domain-containing protein [Antarctobacter sp.]
MRIIIFGVGAVGGVVAAALALTGQDVLGIARGTRLQAIRDRGLTLRSHDGRETTPLPCVGTATEISPCPDDVILMTTKTQDTPRALEDLRTAGFDEQAVFCVQNGVENERLALRLFPNVHGVNVMLPAEYMAPDEAVCFGKPNLGVFDIGRYPRGADQIDAALAEVLTEARIKSFVEDDVMQNKYGKLLVNLGNIVEAALGRGVAAPEIKTALQQEAIAVYRASGIGWRDMGAGDPRRSTLMEASPIEGLTRIGGSTSQSLARGAGSVETDFLNGEIALIARLAGTDAPINTRAAQLAARLAREKRSTGALTPAEMAAELGL